MWHHCNLAAKESGLECVCVSNENFTALVSGSHRCHGLQRNCIKFCIKLEHSSAETSERIQKDTARGNWWLAASPWQHSHSCITSHTEFFGKTSNHPGDSDPLEPRFGDLWLLTFPKTGIIFEMQEILDPQWDSEKYDRAADGDWEKCVRSQGAYFEGDWGAIVLCTMFLVSCLFFSKCLCYVARYLLDRLDRKIDL